LNCPHCGSSNASSRLYCAACGKLLDPPTRPTAAKKLKGKPAVTTWLLLGLSLAMLVLGIVLSHTVFGLSHFGLVLLGPYACLGILPGIAWLRQVNRTQYASVSQLWLYRIIFLLLALLAWPGLLLLLLLRSRVNSQYANPLKFVAIAAAAVVLAPVLMVWSGRAMSIASQRRTERLRSDQSQQIALLAETWGPALLQCDPLGTSAMGAGAMRPAVTTDGLLLFDVTFPHAGVSDWQRELPVSQQATSKDDLVWLACLQQDTRKSKCEYKGGPALNYTLVTMNIRLVYAGEGPFVVQDRLFGDAPDACPSQIHTVNGSIDYVIKQDGSKVNPSELQLDGLVSFEETRAKIEAMILEHSTHE
jgi:hypothetical protein